MQCQAYELGNFTMENGCKVHPRRGWTEELRSNLYKKTWPSPFSQQWGRDRKEQETPLPC